MAMPLSERVSAWRRTRAHPDAMTIGEHFGELRRRLLVAVGAFVVLTCVSVFLYNWEFSLLRHPYCEIVATHSCSFYVTAPLDALSLRVKLAAFGGAVLASPVVLWELWRFITPGLRPTEKRYAVPFVIASVLLFLFGCAVVYVVLPHTLGWLVHVGGPRIRPLLNPNTYFTLVLLLMVLFGITFEFPVLLVALQLARVLKPATLLRHWRWWVIGITLASAFFTPSSDPFSMIALAVPLTFFYFASAGVGKLLRR
jgi:sec-independent protein translocase protein TatC